jgi:hypothetical protein
MDLEMTEKEAEILRIEREKNQNIIRELSSWVNDLTNALLGKDSEASLKLNKVTFTNLDLQMNIYILTDLRAWRTSRILKKGYLR